MSYAVKQETVLENERGYDVTLREYEDGDMAVVLKWDDDPDEKIIYLENGAPEAMAKALAHLLPISKVEKPQPKHQLGETVTSFGGFLKYTGRITAIQEHQCPCGCGHVYYTYTLQNASPYFAAQEGIHEQHIVEITDDAA